MSCYRPLPSQYRDDGTVKVRPFCRDRPAGPDEFEVPCGTCIGCKVDRARAWSIRITHEASSWSRSVVASLDYRPEALKSWSLQYSDFQEFVREIRVELGGVDATRQLVRVKRGGAYEFEEREVKPVRYICAGEYGTENRRPHFHAVLFNLWFPDSQRMSNGRYQSNVAEALWGHGRVVLDHVSPAAAAYVAGYTYGKKYGEEAKDHYEDLVDPATGEVRSRTREFVHMSRRPGIGSRWYDRFASDLFTNDVAIQEGRKYKVPRYYSERFRKDYPELWESIAEARYARAMEKPEESTPERRWVKEQVARAKYHFYEERKL